MIETVRKQDAETLQSAKYIPAYTRDLELTKRDNLKEWLLGWECEGESGITEAGFVGGCEYFCIDLVY